MRENIGKRVKWMDKNGREHVGTIAEYLPKGEQIPQWYISGQSDPKGVRFRTHQLVSKRDNRYIVDCGISYVAEGIRDVEYRMVSVTWPSLIVMEKASHLRRSPVRR